MKTSVRLGLMLLMIAAIVAAAVFFRDKLDVIEIKEYLAAHDIAAPIIFTGIYILAALLMLPSSLFATVGGLLFGPVLGVLYGVTGAVLGAVIVFVISRYLAYDWVSQFIGKRARPVMLGIEREGWKFVAVLRLMPLLPYGFLNYSLALTPVKFLPYLISTIIFMIPGITAFAYIGSLGEAVLEGDTNKLIHRSLIVAALIITLACIPVLVRMLRPKPPVDTEGTDSC